MTYNFFKKLMFCFLLNYIISHAQAQSTLTLITDTTYNGSIDYYLLLHGEKTYVANTTGIMKGRLVKNLIAFPELCAYVKENLALINNYEDVHFLNNIIRCYNDASTISFKIENVSEYFHKYNLYTEYEIQQGPTEEMLKTKQFINSKTLFIETINANNDRTRSTYGSRFTSHFTYGNSPFYSTGFMLCNLRKALKVDKKAVKYIDRYRFMYASRGVLNVIGIGLAAIVVASILDKPPFGLSDNSTPYFGVASAVIIGTRGLRPANYKARCINKAVDTYNMHLQSEREEMSK